MGKLKSWLSRRARSWVHAAEVLQAQWMSGWTDRKQFTDFLVDGVVTQLGSGSKFTEEPRWARPESNLSMLEGAVGVEDAVRLSFDRPCTKRDKVRLLGVPELVAADYRVWRAPLVGNPLHVAVGAPFAAISTADPGGRAWWSSATRVTLQTVAAATDQRGGVS